MLAAGWKADSLTLPTYLRVPQIDDRGRTVRLTLHIQIRRLDGRRLILSPEGDDLVIP